MIDKPLFMQAAAALLFILMLTGCAQKQWRDPLLEKEAKVAKNMVMEAQEQHRDCTCCIDAEITATWDSSIYSGGLIGYLQVMLPTSFKLVAINPLGQPLFAFTTDGRRFQSINAVKGVYKHGKVSSFLNRHDMPEDLLHGDWGKWLTGDLSFGEENIIDLRRDQSARGIWVGVEKTADTPFSKEYLLLDHKTGKLLERVVFNKKDDEAATVRYRKWTTVDGCPLPSSIEIEGPSYGSTISIELKDMITAKDFADDTFYLRLPPGYLRQYYP